MKKNFIMAREDGKYNVKTYDEQGFEVFLSDRDFATLEEAQAFVRKIEKNVRRVEAVQSIIDYAEDNFNFPVMVTPVSVAPVYFDALIDEIDDYVKKAISDYEEAHRYEEDFTPMTEDDAMEQYVSERKAQVAESTDLSVEVNATGDGLEDFDDYGKAVAYIREQEAEDKANGTYFPGWYSIRDNISEDCERVY